MRPKGPRDPVAGPEDGPESPFPITLSGPVIKGFGRGSRELGIPTANIPPSGLSAYPNLQSGVYYGFVGLRLSQSTMQAADNSKLTLSSSSSASESTTTGGGLEAIRKESRGQLGQPMPGVGNDATNQASGPDREKEVNSGVERGAGGGDDDEGQASVYPAVLSIGYNPYYKNETRSIEIHVLHHFPQYNFYHTPLNLLMLGFIRPEYDYESLDALVDDIKTDCDVARKSLERVGYERYKHDTWLREFGWVGSVDVESVEKEVTGEGKEEVKEGAMGEEKGGKL